jgi:hypothetical protein
MAKVGELKRLTIRAYEEPECTREPGVSEFVAYVNPNEVTMSYEMEYDSSSGSGTTASRMDFKKVKPGDLSLAFFLDGTGANGRKIDVQTEVEKFQEVTGYNGAIHRPNYLKIALGTLPVKRCVLKNASVAYKMFKPDGVPLRAVISATFTEHLDDQTRVALAQDESADLTHIRMVQAGDTLPGLCDDVYGNPRLYPQVAEANGLNDFRRLQAGTRIIFPPLEK